MIHDRDLLEKLSDFPQELFSSDVFRATRKSLDPTAPSTSGGRWSLKGGAPVLYTSMEKDGALAEIAFHWSQFTPMPSKPAIVTRLAVSAENTLRLIRTDLDKLGVATTAYDSIDYSKTQEIGAAVGFLDCDGLIIPSARWKCDNLIVFTENHKLTSRLEPISAEEVDWLTWGKDKGLIEA